MRLNGRPIPGLFFRSLMDIIIIFPEKAAEGRRKSVTDMLSLVFSDGLKIDKCQQLLREKYKITLDLYSLKKVRIVTDWYGEGVINGETRAKAETIIGMMEEFGCSLEKALEVAKVSDEDRPWVLEEIEEIRNSS
ncbi:MAG: hypothetical protein J6U12_03580 [Candidatus Methanomethylophilaceae archaeon]|nr:hypothetical protein [Candidatus Methanomethylophilaceae archaeon]